MFCRECGTNNSNGSKFCANCGAPLKDYTKPVENTIMPEDITKKQAVVKEANKSIKLLTITMIVSLIAGIALIVGGFFVANNIAKIVLITFGFGLIAAYFGIKMLKLKHVEKINNVNKN